MPLNPAAMVALAFPAAASCAAVVWVWRTRRSGAASARRRASRHVGAVLVVWLICHGLAAVAFAAWIVWRQGLLARHDALWFLPLLLAPLEYAARFGPVLLGMALVHAGLTRVRG